MPNREVGIRSCNFANFKQVQFRVSASNILGQNKQKKSFRSGSKSLSTEPSPLSPLLFSLGRARRESPPYTDISLLSPKMRQSSLRSNLRPRSIFECRNFAFWFLASRKFQGSKYDFHNFRSPLDSYHRRQLAKQYLKKRFFKNLIWGNSYLNKTSNILTC